MSSVAALTVYNCIYVPPESKRTALDGDTFRCQGKVEPIIPDSKVWVPKVRLVRVNAPETGNAGAEEARGALIAWLMRRPFNLVCFARDKYGRLLADAESGEGLLSQYMLDRNLVVPMSLGQAQSLLIDGSMDTARSIAHPTEVHP